MGKHTSADMLRVSTDILSDEQGSSTFTDVYAVEQLTIIEESHPSTYIPSTVPDSDSTPSAHHHLQLY